MALDVTPTAVLNKVASALVVQQKYANKEAIE